MKTTVSLFLCLLVFQKASALQIARLSVWNVSANTLKVSIDTEADELYYFDSWQYAVVDNTITVEVLFVSGFGSTIAYLNNQFDIPINTSHPDFYRLVVKAYYLSYQSENLQDFAESVFSTPFAGTLLLLDKTLAIAPAIINPNSGELLLDTQIKHIWIFDSAGKYIACLKNDHGKVPLDQFPDGAYVLGYFNQKRYKTFRLVLKKR